MLAPGSRLGRYEIRTLLGAGGMGEVYLAHDTQLLRPVALKVLGAALRSDLELRKRLEYEARAASALNHPNILTVYEVGQEGEDHFIATEYVSGITLRQRMLRAELNLGEVLNIAVQIASALAAADAAGLVHRDVKPDNIMLRPDGYLKLLDFGLARAVDGTQGLRQTDPYVVRGTVFYMSPEQLRGTAVDARTDVWSTGVVLYELISGRLPFDGDSASDVVAAILRNTPVMLTTHRGAPVPPRLEDVVARAMHKDRAQRYQSARELLEDLQRLRADLEHNPSVLHEVEDPRRTITERVAVSDPLPPTNLPSNLTPLVGRDLERREVAELLLRDDVRMVTLTGPGGTGKTRLSLAIGLDLLPDMEDGVQVISLATIRDPELVVSEIAATFGVGEGSAALLDIVTKTLKEKKLLLILDNFEQVTDAAPAIAQLLAATPRVKVLATSRAPLRIAGEHEYAVPPLTMPPLDLPLSHEALASYASVALFLERASAIKSDFTITADNAAAIAELCVRLEGLPLAIELAAARIKLLPPQAMLARLDNRLNLLAGGRRDLPERQQTMRAAISWGYNLLPNTEKRLFSTLSVFRGGFTIPAAEALAGEDVLDCLSSLVDKSFMRRDATSTDDAPRFRMLETIREYGLECLLEDGRNVEVRGAHARLMVRLANGGTDFTREDDNFRAALEWTTASGDVETSLQLAGALWWYWYVHGHYSEGQRWVEAVLAMPGSDTSPARAKVLTGAGALAFLQCDYSRAIAFLDESIDESRVMNDRRQLAQALQFRGSIARERGEYDHAIDLHSMSMGIWRELGDRTNVARSMNNIAFASWLSGDFARTVELCRETLPLFREERETEGTVWSLMNLAAAAHYAGDDDRAEQRLEESLSWSRTGNFKEGIAWSLNLLGCVLRTRGDIPRARTLLRDSLQLHWELGDRWRSSSVLACLAALSPDAATSARLFGAADALRTRLGTPVPPVDRAMYEQDIAVMRHHPDWEVGATMRADDVIALALG
ncbi:MAG TPA: protein kinase [Thermoanaerobaculia bacterium]|jgi:non-specific serine/threonine protein kinase